MWFPKILKPSIILKKLIKLKGFYYKEKVPQSKQSIDFM